MLASARAAVDFVLCNAARCTTWYASGYSILLFCNHLATSTCSFVTVDRSSSNLLHTRKTFGGPLLCPSAQLVNSEYHVVPLPSIAAYADSWAVKLGVVDVGCVAGTGSLLLLQIEDMGGVLGGRVGGRVGGRAGGRVGGRIGARGVCMMQPRTVLLLMLSAAGGCWDLAPLTVLLWPAKGMGVGRGSTASEQLDAWAMAASATCICKSTM